MLLLPFRCCCSKPRSITWPPTCHSCLDMYLSIWKTFTRQGCVNTSVATIRQSGKCIQGCHCVFSFLWIPLPLNLVHFLCKRAFESKDRRERDLSQKNTEAITSTTSVTTCRERRLYIWAKMCWHSFAIGGEGKGTHSPESKYVAIRITASANSLLQMELPTALSFMLGAKNRRCLRAKRRKASFPRSKPATITITTSPTTFVETKLPGNLCDHCWSFFLAKGTLRSIMLVYCKTQPYIKTKSIWNSYAWWQELDEIPCNAKRAQGFWTILSANVNLKEWKKSKTKRITF